MVRIGFEPNDALEERVFPIAFLGLMDGLEPIHSRDMNAESAEHIAVVIQSSILSSQSLFVVNLEDVLQPHFARHRAQVYQLIVATDAARLHSTQECH